MQTLQSLFAKHWIFVVSVYSRLPYISLPCLVIYWNLRNLFEI